MPTPTPQNAQPALVCDWQDWLDDLKHVEANDEEKRALIETLWSIVTIFVDLGWDISLKQPAQNSCGKQPDLTAALLSTVLNSTEKEKA